MPTCDFCGNTTSAVEMRRLPARIVVTAAASGFIPSNLPGVEMAAALGQSQSMYRMVLWTRTVAANQTIDWGVCGSCFREFYLHGPSTSLTGSRVYAPPGVSAPGAAIADVDKCRIQVSYECENCGQPASSPVEVKKAVLEVPGRLLQAHLGKAQCSTCGYRQSWSAAFISGPEMSLVLGLLIGAFAALPIIAILVDGSLGSTVIAFLAGMGIFIGGLIAMPGIMARRHLKSNAAFGAVARRLLPEVQAVGVDGASLGDAFPLCGHYKNRPRWAEVPTRCHVCNLEFLTLDMLASAERYPPKNSAKRAARAAQESRSSAGSDRSVTSVRSWRCPGCSALLTKGGLGKVVFAGQPTQSIQGTATCGSCGATYSQSDIYSGKYDSVLEEAPTASSDAPSEISMVAFLLQSSQPPAGPVDDFCRMLLPPEYKASRIVQNHVVGHADEVSQEEALALYRELVRERTLPDLGSPIHSYRTVEPDGHRVAVLLFG